MVTRQKCARWGCEKSATYDKPLCRTHWTEWDAWDILECLGCHWFYGGEGHIVGDLIELEEKYDSLCDYCASSAIMDKGQADPHTRHIIEKFLEKRPIHAHRELQRSINYIYFLKLSDGTLYVGKTNNLAVRMAEHKDGLQRQTKDRNPRLVYIETLEGMREEVTRREDQLTRLNWTSIGRRRLREMIEEFRETMRLLDLQV